MEEKVELLAPVGSREALQAAVQNGANAVYLGGKLFNARHYASNFDYDQLREAVNYAHLNGVKVYVTVNILIDNSEIDEILDYNRFLYEIDVDAIIVQDLGLASLVRKLFPKLPLHGSTQMTINNLWGARYLENLGFTRVVLARETPLEEIKHIKENCSIELEGFIHGALCVAYSGQCLMSSAIGGRSGNRGRCAQPCRMPYSIVGPQGRLVKDWEKKYILSTRDLNTIDRIDEILKSGISSLKIEGRMKRPEYVATIVKNYRQALDQGLESIKKDSKQDMAQVFNRDFTQGHGLGDFGRSFISSHRPDNRGILLGRVVRIDKYKIYIELEEDLNQDDGLEFILSNGQYRGMKSPLAGKRGTTIALEKPGQVNTDSLVYRTSSAKLLERARESYENKKISRSIDMGVLIKVGEKPRLSIYYGDHLVSTSLDQEVDRARKQPLDREKLYDQLSKLGDTVYHLEDLRIQMDEDAFLPMGAINELRRRACQDLDRILENRNHRERLEDEEYFRLKKEILGQEKVTRNENTKVHIKVASLDQFKQLNLDKLDRVYLGFEENLEESIKSLKEKNKEAYIWTDKILYKTDLERLEKLVKPMEDLLDGISVANLGTYQFARENFNLKIHGDDGLNIFNSYTAGHLEAEGLEGLTMSPELNLEQIRKISSTNKNLETLVYGYLPLMVMKTCPMALVKGCKDDGQCKTCNFAQGYELKDRMNVNFPMLRGEGFTTIFNSVPVMVLDSIERIKAAGISSLRLDFTYELEGIGDIQEVYYDYIRGIIGEREVSNFIEEYRSKTNITNGHYFRGII